MLAFSPFHDNRAGPLRARRRSAEKIGPFFLSPEDSRFFFFAAQAEAAGRRSNRCLPFRNYRAFSFLPPKDVVFPSRIEESLEFVFLPGLVAPLSLLARRILSARDRSYLSLS